MDAATDVIDSSGSEPQPYNGTSAAAQGAAAREGLRAVGAETRGRALSRRLLSLFFIAGGINHFANRRSYEAIVPPRLAGEARTVVDISGVAEIVGGVGVLLPGTRRLAGVWLVAVLAAVFPANPAASTNPIAVALKPVRDK